VADGDGVVVLDGGDEAPVASGVDSEVLKQGETMWMMRLNGKRQEVAGVALTKEGDDGGTLIQKPTTSGALRQTVVFWGVPATRRGDKEGESP
jgi:hypothetical protein